MAKSKLAAGPLGIFVSTLGAHRLYLGFTKRAVLMLLISLVGGVVTLGLAEGVVYVSDLVEGIMYLTGTPNYSTDQEESAALRSGQREHALPGSGVRIRPVIGRCSGMLV